MMNPEARDELDRITTIEPKGLTKDDIGFLKARRMYLRPEQREIYKDVLKGTKTLSTKDQKTFEVANAKEVAAAKKKAEEEAAKAKTIKQAQNPKKK